MIDSNPPDPEYRNMVETLPADKIHLYLSHNPQLVNSFVQAISDTSWVVAHGDLSFKAIRGFPIDNKEERARYLQVMVDTGLFQSMPEQTMALLQEACISGDSELAQSLFAILDPAMRDAEGNSPLHLICRYAKKNVLETILTDVHRNEAVVSPARVPLDPFACINERGAYPLQLVYRNPNIAEPQRFLVEVGVCPIEIAGDAQHESALLQAVRDNRLDTIRILLQRGVNIEARNRHDDNALGYAVSMRDTDTARLLMDCGADIEATDKNGNTPLMVVFRYGCRGKEVGKLLLDRGADINARNKAGETALIFAVGNGNREGVELLLDRGAKVDANVPNGIPLLIFAITNQDEDLFLSGIETVSGVTDVVALLLDHGADIEAKDSNGNTILMLAVMREKQDLVEVLLARGAQINATNIKGQTALHAAIIREQEHVARLLLSKGANARVTDSGDATPLAYAMSSSLNYPNSTLIKMLQDEDRSFSESVYLNKALAHRFGVGGETHSGDSSYSLEGWAPGVAVKSLYHTLCTRYLALSEEMDISFAAGPLPVVGNAWNIIYNSMSPVAQAEVSRLGPEKLKEILATTGDAVRDSMSGNIPESYARLEAGKPLGLTTTIVDPAHTVGMAIIKTADGRYRVARCNKGAGSGFRPGILFDRATRVDLRPITQHTTFQFFNNDIRYAFQFSNVHQDYLRQKPQKVGNCTVANTNSMELALLILQLEPYLGYDVSVEVAQAITKNRTKESRVDTLTAYLEFCEQNPHEVDTDLLMAIHDKNYKDAHEGYVIKYMIMNWFERHPIA